jgi:hypothetical protein
MAEVVDERTHQCLRLLVRDDRHRRPARVLQARRKEMHALPRAIEEAHVDLSEIVLREFSGETLESHERPHPRRSQRRDQLVQGGLTASVPVQLRAAQNFHGEQSRLARQDVGDDGSKRFRLGGPANRPSPAFGVRIDVRDRRFTFDAADASERDAGELGHLGLRVADSPQDLNFVPFEHVDHPLPRCLRQRVSVPAEAPSTGQNFRKGCDQNFRNSSGGLGPSQ